MKHRTPEHEAEHAVRVRVWVTFVMIMAFVCSILIPDVSGWVGFMSSLFWIWRD